MGSKPRPSSDTDSSSPSGVSSMQSSISETAYRTAFVIRLPYTWVISSLSKDRDGETV